MDGLHFTHAGGQVRSLMSLISYVGSGEYRERYLAVTIPPPTCATNSSTGASCGSAASVLRRVERFSTSPTLGRSATKERPLRLGAVVLARSPTTNQPGELCQVRGASPAVVANRARATRCPIDFSG